MSINKIIRTLFTLVMFSYSAVAQKTNFIIKGQLGNLQNPAKVYIGYTTADNIGVFDSAHVVNGHFEFKQFVAHPVNALLSVSRDGLKRSTFTSKDLARVYIEPNSHIILKSTENINERTITGSIVEDQYQYYLKAVADHDNKINAIKREIANGGRKRDSTLMDQFRDATTAHKQATKIYILNHPDQILSLNLLSEYAGQFIDVADVKPIFDKLDQTIQKSFKGIIYAGQIEEARSTAVGVIAPDFVQSKPDGTLLSLSSFRGKYLLLDFWASWCGPCRAENPELKQVYTEFAGTQFDLLAVSLDNKKEHWLNAIEMDGLPWHHVSDLKYWKNEAAVLYGITSVPQNVLIDPNGKIIARNLKGEKLKQKLYELNITK